MSRHRRRDPGPRRPRHGPATAGAGSRVPARSRWRRRRAPCEARRRARGDWPPRRSTAPTPRPATRPWTRARRHAPSAPASGRTPAPRRTPACPRRAGCARRDRPGHLRNGTCAAWTPAGNRSGCRVGPKYFIGDARPLHLACLHDPPDVLNDASTAEKETPRQVTLGGAARPGAMSTPRQFLVKRSPSRAWPHLNAPDTSCPVGRTGRHRYRPSG